MTAPTTTRLFDLAKTIRSKNAGVDRITLDVIFSDRAYYDHVRHSGALSRDAVCRIFGITPDRITDPCDLRPSPGHQIQHSPRDSERQAR